MRCVATCGGVPRRYRRGFTVLMQVVPRVPTLTATAQLTAFGIAPRLVNCLDDL